MRTSEADHTWRCAALRRAVAWLGHAPGLWLLYREVMPARLRWANVLAVLGTLAAMGLATALVEGAPWWQAALLAWIAGHVVWGTILAWLLPPRDAGPALRPWLHRFWSRSCPACAPRTSRS
jgi:hypothetical protein